MHFQLFSRFVVIEQMDKLLASAIVKLIIQSNRMANTPKNPKRENRTHIISKSLQQKTKQSANTPTYNPFKLQRAIHTNNPVSK